VLWRQVEDRIADVLATLLICSSYAPCMPLLNLVACASIGLTLLTDKWMLCKVC
jgi:hypothetical protein